MTEAPPPGLSRRRTDELLHQIRWPQTSDTCEIQSAITGSPKTDPPLHTPSRRIGTITPRRLLTPSYTLLVSSIAGLTRVDTVGASLAGSRDVVLQTGPVTGAVGGAADRLTEISFDESLLVASVIRIHKLPPVYETKPRLYISAIKTSMKDTILSMRFLSQISRLHASVKLVKMS